MKAKNGDMKVNFGNKVYRLVLQSERAFDLCDECAFQSSTECGDFPSNGCVDHDNMVWQELPAVSG